MLISFSYFMLHFTQIAEVGKYLLFFKILLARRKSKSKPLEVVSFVEFQGVPGRRPPGSDVGRFCILSCWGKPVLSRQHWHLQALLLGWQSTADSLSHEIKESPDGSGLKCF